LQSYAAAHYRIFLTAFIAGAPTRHSTFLHEFVNTKLIFSDSKTFKFNKQAPFALSEDLLTNKQFLIILKGTA
jgi:hypothetical protein